MRKMNKLVVGGLSLPVTHAKEISSCCICIHVCIISTDDNHIETEYNVMRFIYKISRKQKWMRGIHRLPVNSPRKGQWRGALMFSLICAWINGWVNNHEAGDLRRHHAHYDVTIIHYDCFWQWRLRRISEQFHINGLVQWHGSHTRW